MYPAFVFKEHNVLINTFSVLSSKHIRLCFRQRQFYLCCSFLYSSKLQ